MPCGLGSSDVTSRDLLLPHYFRITIEKDLVPRLSEWGTSLLVIVLSLSRRRWDPSQLTDVVCCLCSRCCAGSSSTVWSMKYGLTVLLKIWKYCCLRILRGCLAWLTSVEDLKEFGGEVGLDPTGFSLLSFNRYCLLHTNVSLYFWSTRIRINCPILSNVVCSSWEVFGDWDSIREILGLAHGT